MTLSMLETPHHDSNGAARTCVETKEEGGDSFHFQQFMAQVVHWGPRVCVALFYCTKGGSQAGHFAKDCW
jgi:hypothetical protein